MKPSVGRIVHYQRRNLGFELGVEGSVESLAAVIVKVHEDDLVNLTVFTPDGATEAQTSVRYSDVPGEPRTWVWPPRV